METRKKSTPTVDESHLKVIVGLKLKQLRAERGMSLSELADATGISISYLNEIEKGKKFPKSEKVALLAHALEVNYDWLISTKTDKKLAPVAEVLRSKILKEILLDIFGIDKNQLMDLLSRVPVKLNAFLNTLIEISRNYGMSVENFYFSALRSYQEMHENYFDELENAVDRFATQYGLQRETALDWEALRMILEEHYGFNVDDNGLANQPELKDLRSVLIAGTKPTLLLNHDLNRSQKAFILARECAFEFLNIKERPFTTSWVGVDSFEQVLNNFKASYFACSLLLKKEVMVERLRVILGQPRFDPTAFTTILQQFNVSPEILAHRLTNLLPRFFGIQELFFLRFSNRNGTDQFDLTKEMHLAGLHNPHANTMHEAYCRRWISINILKNLSANLRRGMYSQPLCVAQRSRYFGNEKEYLIISFGSPSMEGSPINHSISIGLLLTHQLRKKVMFWNDPAIPIRMVGETCQRCPANDCAERMAVPIVLQERQRLEVMKSALQALGISG